MSVDPITLTLLSAAAASTGGGILASGKQAKLEQARIGLETEQAKLAGAETALQSARSFRSNLSSQLALSSLRSGAGGSLVRQFGSTSMANFLADQGALANKQKFIDISSGNLSAGVKAKKFSNDFSAIGSLLTGGVEAINFNK